MEADAALSDHCFAELRFLSYGAAGLSEDVFRRLQALAVAATGRRIPTLTKYGPTQTQGPPNVRRPPEPTGASGPPFAGHAASPAPAAHRPGIPRQGPPVAPALDGAPAADAAAT